MPTYESIAHTRSGIMLAEMFPVLILATAAQLSDPYAVESLPGVPANLIWGMVAGDVTGSSGGAIQAPEANDIDAMLPGPNGLHMGAKAVTGDYSQLFYFSPMSNRLSAALIKLRDGSKDGTKCLPWLAEIHALLGDPLSTNHPPFGRTMDASWITLSTKVTYLLTYKHKQTSCSVLLEHAQPLPPR